jgi:hexosaminidase
MVLSFIRRTFYNEWSLHKVARRFDTLDAEAFFLVRLLLSAILGALILIGMPAAPRQISIIPQPVTVTGMEGEFILKPDTVVVTDKAAAAVARRFTADIAAATGYKLKIAEGAPARDNSIALSVDDSLGKLGAEGYRLEVTSMRVTVRAPKPAGVFYGTQSIRQLLPPAVYGKASSGVTWSMPCVRIEDYPRFGWRGGLIDVGRHFMPKEALLRFIDVLAMHKMNSIQFHFTDDQGWRVEVKKYPKLTEIGSRRKETIVGNHRNSTQYDGIPHAGYYTQADLREIVAYAAERFINVVPEIEMPGHAQAAIAAYPELGNTGEKLEVRTTWGVNKNVFNANESTILFLQDVLKEMMAIFPSKFIHVGGDEVPKDQWKASAEAQARIKALGLKNEEELQSYFIRRMDQFLTANGRRLVGWDEILEGGLAPGATVMSWRGIEGGIAAARAGHDVVMAPTTYTYFDYYQAKTGEPLALGGFLPLDKVYEFEPIPQELTAEEGRRVLGAQGQLWTEYISTPEYLEYMTFPRMSALAEVVWTPKARKDYSSFLARMGVQEERLRARGVNYRALDKK